MSIDRHHIDHLYRGYSIIVGDGNIRREIRVFKHALDVSIPSCEYISTITYFIHGDLHLRIVEALASAPMLASAAGVAQGAWNRSVGAIMGLKRWYYAQPNNGHGSLPHNPPPQFLPSLAPLGSPTTGLARSLSPLPRGAIEASGTHSPRDFSSPSQHGSPVLPSLEAQSSSVGQRFLGSDFLMPSTQDYYQANHNVRDNKVYYQDKIVDARIWLVNEIIKYIMAKDLPVFIENIMTHGVKKMFMMPNPESGSLLYQDLCLPFEMLEWINSQLPRFAERSSLPPPSIQ